MLTKLIIIFALLTNINVYADEAECRSVLKKCDIALRAEQDLNNINKEIIKNLTAVNNFQSEQLKEQSIWKPIAIGGVSIAIVETLILVLRK